MNRLLLPIALLASTSCIVAHDHHHRSKEELLVVVTELQQEITQLQQDNQKKSKIIETLDAVRICQQDELLHLKHKFPENHHYHGLMKILAETFGIR
jgi:predicted nucleic acid binding AN1-type Zn finger protein